MTINKKSLPRCAEGLSLFDRRDYAERGLQSAITLGALGVTTVRKVCTRL
jgi:hypothetical protein